VAINWPIIPYDPFFNINTSEDLEKANELVLSGLIID
jgi:molybdopterin-guanine dinucleotide biosynthesis protein A